MAIVDTALKFSTSFEGGIQIGDIWYGNGIWDKPIDFPSDWPVSLWQFGTVGGQVVAADAGMWSTIPEVLDLYNAGAKSCGVEYKNEYGYGVNWYFSEWGYNQIGQATWDFLINYVNDNYYFIWGDVYSGLAIARASGANNQFRFYGFYGLYENEETGDKRIACNCPNMTVSVADLESGGFSWYTNVTSKTGSDYNGTRGSGVWWVHPRYNWGSGDNKAIATGTYAMTDYSRGYILYGVSYNHPISDTLTSGFTGNAFGGAFPNLFFELNSVESPYAGIGAVYNPYEITMEGYELTKGGAFIGATDTSPEASYTPAGSNGGGGGYDNSSDSQDFPDSSQFATDALNSGLITVFNPTKQQLIDFASFLYSDSITDVIANQLKRLIADPLDYIISLNTAHFTPTVSTSNVINFGGVSTGVSAGVVSPQFQFLDCGEVEIPEQTNSFQDYGQFSSVKIYLPYCGIHELSINEVMGGKIWVQYVIDCLTGSCVANVKITRHRNNVMSDPYLDAIIYTFTGNCFTSVPITSRDFQSTITGLMGVASSVGTFMGGLAGGNPAMMATGAGGVLSNAMNSTPSAQRVGNYSSNYGYMQLQTPFVILERPMASIPDRYENYYGRPLYDYMQVGNCDGYVEIDTDTLWTDKFDFITSEEEQMLKDICNSGGIYMEHNTDYTNYNPSEED